MEYPHHAAPAHPRASLQKLAVLEATGRRGSFTRTSNELALTQSALSKQVRQLEVTLGVDLLTRA